MTHKNKSTAGNSEITGERGFSLFFWWFAAFIVSAALFPLSRTNYPLFHLLVELGSVIVSVTIFSIGWNSRKIARNDFFTLLAIAFLVVAGLDLLHAMSYKGMGIFPEAGVDPPTQFWIAARALQAVSFLLAAILLGQARRMEPWSLLWSYLAVGVLLALAVWPLGIFPECLIEGVGLTPFKIISEYLICLVLLASGILFGMKRRFLDGRLLRMLLLTIGLSIFSELAFTLYNDVYGFANYLGHLLKIAAVLALYRALVSGALQKPYQTLFRDLAESHQALDDELNHRRLAQEELRAANQELDAFVRTASHDLRTPLSVIISGTEFLQHELSDRLGKEYLELIGTIENQGRRMSILLNDMLTLARVGTMDQPAEVVCPAGVAAQVVADLDGDITAACCRVETGDMPPLKAHSTLIYQLLLNLVANAVRHGVNTEKPVKISGTRTRDRYLLTVRDHGPGIPCEEQERIFEVFYRIGDKQTQGTGIGLATVHKIARYYNGRAYVEETPGGGATFRVDIEAGEPG